MSNSQLGEKGVNVAEWGLFSYKGRRRTMEDAHVFVDVLGQHEAAASLSDDQKAKLEKFSLFAIFDGHGGKSASEYCKLHVVEHFLRAFTETPETDFGGEFWTKVFAELDKAMKEDGHVDFPGSTATVVLWDNANRVIYVANVGDTHAFFVPGEEAPIKRLTADHHCNDPEEAKRITEAGGFVANDRVNGSLGVTRALGDHHMKTYIISAPHCEKVEGVKEGDGLVVCCDGVWDVLTGEDAAAHAKEAKEKGEALKDSAKALVKKAFEKGSTDNLSALIVFF